MYIALRPEGKLQVCLFCIFIYSVDLLKKFTEVEVGHSIERNPVYYLVDNYL